MSPTMLCLHCRQLLIYLAGVGWVHRQGRGLYMQHCTNCGHKAAIYPSPVECPNCGAVVEWRDDHCAAPDMSATRPTADIAFERARGRILGLPEKKG